VATFSKPDPRSLQRFADYTAKWISRRVSDLRDEECSMVKVLLGTIWALFAVMLLGVCAIYGLFWYESFSGELDGDNNAPIYVATDEAAFAILQRLPLDNPEQLRQAERRTNGRVLAVEAERGFASKANCTSTACSFTRVFFSRRRTNVKCEGSSAFRFSTDPAKA